MNEVINELNQMQQQGELSKVTHGVLKKLAKKRKKERFWFTLLNINGIFLGFLYLLLMVTIQPVFHESFNSASFKNWLMMNDHMMSVSFIIIGHMTMRIAKTKHEEADTKYARVRKEVIDREGELWNRHVEDAESRFKVMSLFDKKEVNLFHK